MIENLEVLVEERSMKVALDALIPRIVEDVVFDIHVFDGKHNLLSRLQRRLQGYASYIRNTSTGVVVLIDEDRQDCMVLKDQLEVAALNAGLPTLSRHTEYDPPLVMNRIASEELEAWFFGDSVAIHSAYPKVGKNLSKRKKFRNPDRIPGGTAEALEDVLTKAGYLKGAMRKTVVARDIAVHMDVERNTSPSFVAFRDGLRRLILTEVGVK